jgi:para-aminobenzoate synthetase component 1
VTEAIQAGDIYQANLTFPLAGSYHGDPLALYAAVRADARAGYGGVVWDGSHWLLSFSPELFFKCDGTNVTVRPMKGTAPRGRTDAEDQVNRSALAGNAKDRAENLMIVDLMRNDIARVSEVGSVSVPRLLAVETYAHVHQLVSTVRGRLAPGLSAVDAVVACFPAGSMTGAPKHSAVTILDGLERRARGVYAGAFGYFGLDGRVELSMVIRSILLDAEGATIGSGGGITALSVPAEELAEVKLKAAALLAVLGVPSG